MHHNLLLDNLYTGRVGLRIIMNSDKVVISTHYEQEDVALTHKSIKELDRHVLESILRKMDLRTDGVLIQSTGFSNQELVTLCRMSKNCW